MMNVDNDEKQRISAQRYLMNESLCPSLLKGWLKTGKVNTIACQLQGDLP